MYVILYLIQSHQIEIMYIFDFSQNTRFILLIRTPFQPRQPRTHVLRGLVICCLDVVGCLLHFVCHVGEALFPHEELHVSHHSPAARRCQHFGTAGAVGILFRAACALKGGSVGCCLGLENCSGLPMGCGCFRSCSFGAGLHRSRLNKGTRP